MFNVQTLEEPDMGDVPGLGVEVMLVDVNLVFFNLFQDVGVPL